MDALFDRDESMLAWFDSLPDEKKKKRTIIDMYLLGCCMYGKRVLVVGADDMAVSVYNTLSPFPEHFQFESLDLLDLRALDDPSELPFPKLNEANFIIFTEALVETLGSATIRKIDRPGDRDAVIVRHEQRKTYDYYCFDCEYWWRKSTGDNWWVAFSPKFFPPALAEEARLKELSSSANKSLASHGARKVIDSAGRCRLASA